MGRIQNPVYPHTYYLPSLSRGSIFSEGGALAPNCKVDQKDTLMFHKSQKVKDLQEVIAPYENARYILLDSYDPIMPGGTGKTFDWNKVERLTDQQQSRLVLAGGLKPDNVRLAIETVRPFGVDVSSGVEASKGIKDVEKMKSFIEGVKASDQ